jgi:hypothetical protein
VAYDLFAVDSLGSLFEVELNQQGRLVGVRMTVPVGRAVRIIVRRAGNVLADQRWPETGVADAPIVQEWRVPSGQVAAGVEYTCEMT